MITSLQIRNFAIIDAVELELGPGLSVLTGETGAGKSILVDALGLALGDRADARSVRAGAERAEIALTIDVADLPGLRSRLEEEMLDDGEECLIRRVVSAEGRSRAYVNGQQVAVQTLRAIGELVIDIHGQHEHQSLMRPNAQRRLLDRHGGHETLLAAVGAAYERWQSLRDELDAVAGPVDERNARLELLRFQAVELAELGLGEEELAALESEHHRLAHADRLAAGVQTVLDEVFDAEASAQARLGRALRTLSELAGYDPALSASAELLEQAEIQLSEAADDLRRYGDRLEIDPERQDWVEQRLGTIRQLARRHRVDDGELHAVLPALEEEIDRLAHAEERAARIEAELAEAERAYEHAATALHEARVEAAAELGGRVSEIMQELGMPGGRLVIEVERSDTTRVRPHGQDTVTFLVAANPGQPPRPLARVASGGELSRISLAIQVVAADASTIPCMVFDEVDTGVGGGVAEIVGRRLRQLGRSRQVLCVTHLPQVASQGHSHLSVSKTADGGETRTSIQALSDAGRVEELARMLGGVRITSRTRAHAEEMLKSAAG
jgi:DNA repair protein RecN (Recombination protein N)